VGKTKNLWGRLTDEDRGYEMREREMRRFLDEAEKEKTHLARLVKARDELRNRKAVPEEGLKEGDHGHFILSLGVKGFATDEGFLGLFVRSRNHGEGKGGKRGQGQDRFGAYIRPTTGVNMASDNQYQEQYRVPFHPGLTHVLKVNVYDSLDNWVIVVLTQATYLSCPTYLNYPLIPGGDGQHHPSSPLYLPCVPSVLRWRRPTSPDLPY
jgi:hypothetical protein